MKILDNDINGHYVFCLCTENSITQNPKQTLRVDMKNLQLFARECFQELYYYLPAEESLERFFEALCHTNSSGEKMDNLNGTILSAEAMEQGLELCIQSSEVLHSNAFTTLLHLPSYAKATHLTHITVTGPFHDTSKVLQNEEKDELFSQTDEPKGTMEDSHIRRVATRIGAGIGFITASGASLMGWSLLAATGVVVGAVSTGLILKHRSNYSPADADDGRKADTSMMLTNTNNTTSPDTAPHTSPTVVSTVLASSSTRSECIRTLQLPMSSTSESESEGLHSTHAPSSTTDPHIHSSQSHLPNHNHNQNYSPLQDCDEQNREYDLNKMKNTIKYKNENENVHLSKRVNELLGRVIELEGENRKLKFIGGIHTYKRHSTLISNPEDNSNDGNNDHIN